MEQFLDAVESGNTEKVKQFLSIDPSYKDNLLIRRASALGFYDIVKLLLQDPRVDPGAYANEAIRMAVNGKHPRVVNLLLEDSRVNPADYHNQALRIAIASGNEEITDLLLSDSRVDWRELKAEQKENLIKKEKNKLKSQFTKNFLYLRRKSPTIKLDKKDYSAISNTLLKKIIYEAPYSVLCQVIKGSIPPIKLVALADILQIQYDKNTVSHEELCRQVGAVLSLMM